eukprot:5011476-Lingulodinium_polyedra.AAC.1
MPLIVAFLGQILGPLPEAELQRALAKRSLVVSKAGLLPAWPEEELEACFSKEETTDTQAFGLRTVVRAQ